MTHQDESALPFFDHVSKLDGPAKFLKWNSHGPAFSPRKRRLQPLPATACYAGKGGSLRLRVPTWLPRRPTPKFRLDATLSPVGKPHFHEAYAFFLCGYCPTS